MADIVHFSEAKADLSGDSRDWSPLDMLKALVRDVEAGKIKIEEGICVHFWEKTEEGRIHHYSIAEMTFPQHVALLSVAIHETISDFRGE